VQTTRRTNEQLPNTSADLVLDDGIFKVICKIAGYRHESVFPSYPVQPGPKEVWDEDCSLCPHPRRRQLGTHVASGPLTQGK